MTIETDGTFRFNDELLLLKADQEVVRRKYSLVAYALINEQLRTNFPTLDEKAKRLKSNFRWAGFVTITGTLVALLLAVLEPILIIPAAEAGEWHKFIVPSIAAVAALLGIGTFIVARFEMGIGDRKNDWLRARFVTERIRQWHFQYLLAHFAVIANSAGDPDAESAFIDRRMTDLKELLLHIEKNTQHLFQQQFRGPDRTWIVKEMEEWEPFQAAASVATHGAEAAGDQLLDAIVDIRFRGQKEYCEWIMSDAGFWLHPRTQLRLLHGAADLLLLAIAVLHLAILVGVLFTIPSLKAPLVYAGILVGALCALAVRAVEVGLRPAEQFTRLDGYLNEVLQSEVAAAKERSMVERLVAARHLESAAAREMRSFLESGGRARYIM